MVELNTGQKVSTEMPKIIFSQNKDRTEFVLSCKMLCVRSSGAWLLPPPAAAWWHSCWSPGPAADCTSAGSQPQCESQSAPCSAVPPCAHLFLPEINAGKKLIINYDCNVWFYLTV